MGSNPVQLVAIAVAAVSGAAALVFVFWLKPRAAVVVWTLVMFFVPIWVRVSVMGVTVTAITAVTVLAIVAGGWCGLKWSNVDTVILIFVGTLLLARAFGHSESGHLQQVLLLWIVPYIWGRLVLARVPRSWLATCIGTAALIVALFAIWEFITGANIFLSIPGADGSVWGGTLERADLLRVEASFGHPIALGGALAMSAAFVATAKWPTWARASTLVIIGTATALTFSRLGIVGFVVTVGLAAFLLRKQVGRALRWVLVVGLGAGIIGGLPALLQVFGEAGAEAQGSAGYRADLVSLVDSMVFIGISPSHEILPTGVDYWGGFRSIDSALILVGLQFGLIPMGIAIVLIIALLIGTVRRASAANVALVAQIPAFATVALITQYAAMVWFIAGLAVASFSRDEPQETSGPPGAVIKSRTRTDRAVTRSSVLWKSGR